jgi:hypothetical protein
VAAEDPTPPDLKTRTVNKLLLRVKSPVSPALPESPVLLERRTRVVRLPAAVVMVKDAEDAPVVATASTVVKSARAKSVSTVSPVNLVSLVSIAVETVEVTVVVSIVARTVVSTVVRTVEVAMTVVVVDPEMALKLLLRKPAPTTPSVITRVLRTQTKPVVLPSHQAEEVAVVVAVAETASTVVAVNVAVAVVVVKVVVAAANTVVAMANVVEMASNVPMAMTVARRELPETVSTNLVDSVAEALVEVVAVAVETALELRTPTLPLITSSERSASTESPDEGHVFVTVSAAA